MKLKSVTAEVEAIAKIVGDNEAAHSYEDALHRDVLRAIAEGARNPRALAREALRTLELEYTRWYA